MGLLHEGRFLDVTIPFCVMIQNLLFVMKHPPETLRQQNLFFRDTGLLLFAVSVTSISVQQSGFTVSVVFLTASVAIFGTFC